MSRHSAWSNGTTKVAGEIRLAQDSQSTQRLRSPPGQSLEEDFFCNSSLICENYLRLDQVNSANLLFEFWFWFVLSIRWRKAKTATKAVPPDDHLQEAGPCGWSFVNGRPLRFIICCKRPVLLDDLLQENGSFGWSFARDLSLRMQTWNLSQPSRPAVVSNSFHMCKFFR